MKEKAAVRVIDTVVGVCWCEREVPWGAIICQNISYLWQQFPVVLTELKVFPLPTQSCLRIGLRISSHVGMPQHAYLISVKG